MLSGKKYLGGTGAKRSTETPGLKQRLKRKKSIWAHTAIKDDNDEADDDNDDANNGTRQHVKDRPH